MVLERTVKRQEKLYRQVVEGLSDWLGWLEENGEVSDGGTLHSCN